MTTQTPEQRWIGRDLTSDDPAWLHAFVYAHDAVDDDPDGIARLLTESGFNPEDLARALCHAIQEKEKRVEVVRVEVLQRPGHQDQVYLQTTKPSPFPPDVDDSDLTISFRTRPSLGTQYVRAYFGREPDRIIKAPGGF